MPLWHCPHCGTPQAEAARCWVCRKSSTSCATCRHFRRGVAGGLGYCGLDRRRDPLRGDELRGCWEASAPLSPGFGTRTVEALQPARAPLAWHDVTDPDGLAPSGGRVDAAAHTTAAASAAAPLHAAVPLNAAGPGLGFWGDPEA